MKRKVSKVCPQCEKETCNDAESCRLDWDADRLQDHKDFVADMEESKIAKEMARKGA